MRRNIIPTPPKLARMSALSKMTWDLAGRIVFSHMPLAILHQLTRPQILIVYYHMISDIQVPHVRHLYQYRTTTQFRRDLDLLLHFYEPISLRALLDSLQDGGPLPDRPFLLTFDDGFREMYDIVVPILKKKGVPATFFLTTSTIDNRSMCHHEKISLLLEHLTSASNSATYKKIRVVLSSHGFMKGDVRTSIRSIPWEHSPVLDALAQIADLSFEEYLGSVRPYLDSSQVASMISDGFSFGAHSVDHPLFATLSLEEQLRQARDSVAQVKKQFRLSYGAFAFPHSDRGVSQDFFAKIYSEGDLHVSFAGRGIVVDTVARHFQRFSMEQDTLEVRDILAREYGRATVKRLLGRGKILRDRPLQ